MLLVDKCGSDAITGQLIHMPWNRLHVADVVFPVFLLVVGVTIPFSPRTQRPRSALWRVVELALLSWLIVTAEYGWGQAFPGVLGHIAGAYVLCWLLLRLRRRTQIPATAPLRTGISLLFATVPADGGGHPALSAHGTWAG
jgi:predicted acyltransferase